MRSSLVLVALALVSLAGCASTADDSAASGADLTAAKITPHAGLFTGTAVSRDDTCGQAAGLDRLYVVDPTASGYATSYVYPNVDTTGGRFTLALAGKGGSSQSTQTLGFSPDVTVTITTTLLDTWQSPTAFVRRATDTFACAGDGCGSPDVQKWLSMKNTLPCTTTEITAFAEASCDAYPFRQTYDDTVTSVWVSGTFNGWAKTPAEGALEMKKGADGAWTLDAALPVPADGKHLYKFIKNGAWYWDQDAANPLSVDDGQTGTNSILYCQ